MPIGLSVADFDVLFFGVFCSWLLVPHLPGNDFIPHLPTLDIGEGGLDTLFQIYKEELPKLGGYITNQVNTQLK